MLGSMEPIQGVLRLQPGIWEKIGDSAVVLPPWKVAAVSIRLPPKRRRTSARGKCFEVRRRNFLRCLGGAAAAGLLQCAAGAAIGSVQAASVVAVYPEQFGAVGNGFADDSEAWIMALRYLSARGGGTLYGTSGATYRINIPIPMTSLSNIQLIGNGAKLFRYTTGTASNALTLTNCRDILITDWIFDSSYNGFSRGSTGSNPNIQLGVAPGSLNKNIRIIGNRFSNGNHANITISTTGIDSKIPGGRFAHEDIWITDNYFSNAGAAVFIYKAARRIYVTNNVGRNFSSLALALDTGAATDNDRNSYTVEAVTIAGNTFNNIRTHGSFAGRGLTLKGGLHDIQVSENHFEDIVSTANVETYGIILTQDQHRPPASGSRIRINNNIVLNVSSASGTAAWALTVNGGYLGVVIDSNRFESAERGCRLSNSSEWTFTGNTLVSLGTESSSPIDVICERGASAKAKLIDRNTFIKGKGIGSTAVNVNAGCSNLQRGNNRFEGFANQFHLRTLN